MVRGDHDGAVGTEESTGGEQTTQDRLRVTGIEVFGWFVE